MAHSHTHKPHTRGRHINWASHYDLMCQLISLGSIRKVRSKTIELAELSEGMSVAELGCGTGDLSRRAKKAVGQNGRVLAIDASRNMIAEAQKKAANEGLEIEFFIEGMQALRLPTETVDRIIASLSVHHVLPEDRENALKEMVRILKSGGKLIIVDFDGAKGGLGGWLMNITGHDKGAQIVTEARRWFESAGLGSTQQMGLPFPGLQALVVTKA